MCGTLSSSFMLYSVGLGAGAVPTAGAINWILKDGLGQFGTLMFAKTLSHRFDINTKTWYLLGSIMYVCAVALELSTIIFPNYFLLLGSFANALKGLSWMCAGSTRSAFNVCWAQKNNIADITAKATSQTILFCLTANLAGAGLVYYVGQDAFFAFSAFGKFMGYWLWLSRIL